jgi:hypothetical protein
MKPLASHQLRRIHGAIGLVAEVSTQEQCISLYPGSNPGWASSLITAQKNETRDFSE